MRIVILAAGLLLSACATTEPRAVSLFDLTGSHLKGRQLDKALAGAAAHPLGSEKNPVRAAMPPGQRAYLARLRCSDGSAPTFERAGSVGESPYGSIMDLYQLKCATGTPATASVYMDMYHDHVEDRPIPGFTIAPR